MLTKEEVQGMIDAALALKTKPAGKKGADAGQEAIVAARKDALVKRMEDADPKLYIKNQSCNLEARTNDSKPYYPVNLHKFDGTNATVSLFESENKECKVPDFKKPQFNIAPELTFEFSKMADEGISDMVEIDELNPATLLFNLANRYKRYDIYCYVGPILLACNPFKAVPELATDELKAQCMAIKDDPAPLQLKKQLQPHIWVVSALAYRQLRETRSRQAIVISGESGAGKTESARIAMNLLTDLGSDPEAKKEEQEEKPIGDKILACNPILEGFGNAKTSRNDNSSRFGKYTLMYFSLSEDKIYGARIQNYLLEKSRIVKVTTGERGYHIFYFLLLGAPLPLLKTLGLLNDKGERMSPYDYAYLSQQGAKDTWGDLPVKHDEEGYAEVEQTFKDLKFSEEEQKYIWNCVAVTLLMGQINFDEPSFAGVDEGKGGSIKNPDLIKHICTLLGIEDWENFQKCLLNSIVKIRNDTTVTPLSYAKAVDNRDAFAKQLFNNMFDWLVIRMNLTIQPEEIDDPSFDTRAKTIGLLDIFGFENFEPGSRNNYEQLCINYVNEKLHKLYIAAIFEAECIELKDEGLGSMVESVQYPDLKVLEIIRVLDYKNGSAKYKGIKFTTPPGTGLFTMIDDFSTQKLQGRSIKWEDVFSTMDQQHGKNTKIYVTDRKARNSFLIHHSAQDVKYLMQEFVDRNVDSIPDQYEDMINNQANKQVKLIYNGVLDESELEGSKKKLKTIWGKFDAQMLNLMNELAEPLLQMGEEKQKELPENLENTKLHFIRCIKPRPKPEKGDKMPGFFCHTMTLQQITYMGVMESVDLKQKNFPFRKKFEEFYAEYELLSPRFAQKRYYQMDRAEEDFETLAKAIVNEQLQGCGQDLYALGNYKVLMMPEIRDVLEECKRRASVKRDEMAGRLKKAFCLLSSAQEHSSKKSTMQCVQARYKLKHLKLKKVWAKNLKQKFEIAMQQYKAEKRKAFEEKSGKNMREVLKKHQFRNKLSKSLAAREKLTRYFSNHAYLNKIQKHLMSSILAQKIHSQAFNRARERIDGKAAWEVQRAIRGYFARSKGDRKQWVQDALIKKENLQLEVSAKKIQRRLKGLLVRRRLHDFNVSVTKIQSYYRMILVRQVFLKIKRNTNVIQRGVRRYFARKDMLVERMKKYLTQQLTVTANVRDLENFQLFGYEGDESSCMVKNHTPYSARKVFIMQKVVDLHVISDLSEMYSLPWGSQYQQIYRECIANETPIHMLSVGTSHNLAVAGKGKVYAWGWNDNGQCALNPQYVDEVIVESSAKQAALHLDLPASMMDKPGEVKVKQIKAVEDRCLMLCGDSGELLVWGGNEKGQLGLGHYTDTYSPQSIDYFKKQNMKVLSMDAGGNLTLACTDTGDSFAWPFVYNGQNYAMPVRMPFSERIKISRVACGYNFGFFISMQGYVYALGKDNQDGQLGLGHRYPNDIPEMVSCLREIGERIDSIECGFRHAIARSTLGKVYTWGWNGHGQLGHGHFDSELSPRLLELSRGTMKREKILQIGAGYSHTVVMTDNRELLQFGTCGNLQKQATPVLMNLSETLPSLFPPNSSVASGLSGQQFDYAVVKLNCSWSKSMSVTNLSIVDLRAIKEDQSFGKVGSVLKQLSAKWDQRDILPPYIDVISGLFPASVMKKPPNYQGSSAVKITAGGVRNGGAFAKKVQESALKPRK